MVAMNMNCISNKSD